MEVLVGDQEATAAELTKFMEPTVPRTMLTALLGVINSYVPPIVFHQRHLFNQLRKSPAKRVNLVVKVGPIEIAICSNFVAAISSRMITTSNSTHFIKSPAKTLVSRKKQMA